MCCKISFYKLDSAVSVQSHIQNQAQGKMKSLLMEMQTQLKVDQSDVKGTEGSTNRNNIHLVRGRRQLALVMVLV